MKNTNLIFSIIMTMIIHGAFAQPGILDSDFDADGKVLTSFGMDEDGANAVAIQPDGRIVAAGLSWNGTDFDFALARYNSDGTLDNTFSTDGKLTTSIGTSTDRIYAVAIQSDGKIVAAGYSYNGSDNDFALARYNADGTLDNNFSSDGKLTTPIGASNERIRSIVIQPDGKIVAGGYSYNGSDYDFALARYNSDGSLDNSFSTDGKLTTDISANTDFSFSVALQSDGKIVIAGYTYAGIDNDYALARYNPDGTLDNTFSTDGKHTTSVGASDDKAYSLAIQPDGKLVMVGNSDNAGKLDFSLVRFNTDGTLDNSFSIDGKLTTAISTGNDFGRSVVIQPDGKILVAGYGGSSGLDFALARYNSDGTLDNSFSIDGKLTTAIGSSDDYAYGMALQPNGRIVVAGISYSAVLVSDFSVARYISGLNVGIIDLSPAQNALIYPNPVQSNISLEYTLLEESVIRIDLYDISGKLVKPLIVPTKRNQGKYVEQLNIADDVKPGNYILSITNGIGSTSIKIIKQ